jgi:hypothetical protein
MKITRKQLHRLIKEAARSLNEEDTEYHPDVRRPKEGEHPKIARQNRMISHLGEIETYLDALSSYGEAQTEYLSQIAELLRKRS